MANKTDRYFLPFLVFVILSFIYISTAPPAVYLDDSGETITDAFTLGIQHPPGYPLYTLLGKLATFLPAADISYRLYLLAAIISAINALLLYYLVLITGKRTGLPFPGPAAFFSSLIFAFGLTMWQQATNAKGGIYALNIFFTLLIIMAVLGVFSAGSARKYFYLCCFLFGLALANHHMSQFAMLPAYLFLMHSEGMFKKLKIKNFSAGFVLLLAGASAYLYLPLRAHALINWGEPDSFGSFFEVLSRWQYASSEITRSLKGSVSQAADFFRAAAQEHLIPGFILSLAGAFFLFKKEKNLFYFLVSLPVIFLLIITLYLNISSDKAYLIEVYILPCYIAFSILAITGVYGLAALLPAGKNLKAFLSAIVLCSLVISQVALFYPKNDRSRYYFAYDYCMNMLSTLDYGSLLFMAGDNVVFPCWYLKFVKNIRPDVTLLGTPLLPMKWARDFVTTQNPAIRMPDTGNARLGTESTGRLALAAVNYNYQSMPLYYAYNKPEPEITQNNFVLMPKGLVYRVALAAHSVVTPGYVEVCRAQWKIYAMRCLFPPFNRYNDAKSTRLYATDYAICANSAGVFFEEKGLFPLAAEFYSKAHALSPLEADYLFNMGNAFYLGKKISDAVSAYEKALEVNPRYYNAWFNLGVLFHESGDGAGAAECFRKVKQINPAYPGIDMAISGAGE